VGGSCLERMEDGPEDLENYCRIELQRARAEAGENSGENGEAHNFTRKSDWRSITPILLNYDPRESVLLSRNGECFISRGRPGPSGAGRSGRGHP